MQQENMAWRLGLDIGTNSIGWAVLELEEEQKEDRSFLRFVPCSLVDMGVRVYADGREPAGTHQKTGLPRIGESRAVTRRVDRGMRRNRDRRQKRIRYFVQLLIAYGLLPEDQAVRNAVFKKDPYQARSKAAGEPVDAHILGRALAHICKRRGFLSNKKTDGEDKEVKGLKEQMSMLEAHLQEKRLTLGQYFYNRIQRGEHIRFRGNVTEKIQGEEKAMYPKRKMYMDEFDSIRKMQSAEGLITDAQWDRLYEAFTYQRPLLPKKPGVCSFENKNHGLKDQKRASRALPISHTFRIVQEVNNLKIVEDTTRDLTQKEREILYEALENKKSITWRIMRKAIKLPKDARFNFENENNKRKGFDGNGTACALRPLFKEHDKDWDDQSPEVQNAIVQWILDAKDEDDFLDNAPDWGFSTELQKALAKKYFPSSHGHLSRLAMEKLLPLMQEGKLYWEAAREVYHDHTEYSLANTGEVQEELPYYGEILIGSTTPMRKTVYGNKQEETYGKIQNPTVHVALNQLRVVVNSLIKRYGNPCEIHLELANNLKMAGKKYAEHLKFVAENTKTKEKHRTLYKKVTGREPGAEDLIKMKLWEELGEGNSCDDPHTMGRLDIYTGKNICLSRLLSDEVEIEHILPFSKTYDNSMANKTVTFREVNRVKGDTLPYAFVSRAYGKEEAEKMAERAKRLSPNKRWRFLKDAQNTYEKKITGTMTAEEKKKFELDKDQDFKEGAFIDRQLVDTQYICKIARKYLVPVVGAEKRVVPVKGAVVSMVRGKWGFDKIKAKGTADERKDHRHHAVDALVVGLTDRWLLQNIATEKKKAAHADKPAKLYIPYPKWLDKRHIETMLDTIVISHKQDHSHEGRFFEETAYGILKDTDPHKKVMKKGKPVIKGGKPEEYHGVCRRAIAALKESEVECIRDPLLREAIGTYLYSKEGRWEDRLAYLAKEGVKVHIKPQKVLLDNGTALYKKTVERDIATLKESEVGSIHDFALREAISLYLHGKDGKWEDRIVNLKQQGVMVRIKPRRLRINIKNQSLLNNIIPSAPYKGYTASSYAFCDIWCVPAVKKGKFTGQWKYQGVFISYADAKRYEIIEEHKTKKGVWYTRMDEKKLQAEHKPHPAAKKIMRLYKHDMVELTEEDGSKAIYNVVGLSAASGRLTLRLHVAAEGEKPVAINVLMTKKAMRRVRVTPDGRVIRA